MNVDEAAYQLIKYCEAWKCKQFNHLLKQVIMEASATELSRILMVALSELQQSEQYRSRFCKYVCRSKQLPHVTQILQDCTSISSTIENSDRQRTPREMARQRGRQFHEFLAQYLHSPSVDCPENLQPWFHSIQPVLEQLQDVRLIEQATFYPAQLYVGRIDCVASYRGIDCIVEWKSAETYVLDRRDEYALQAVAYLDAINQTHKLSIKNSLVVVALKGQKALTRWIREDTVNSYLIQWQQIRQKFHQKNIAAETEKSFNQSQIAVSVCSVFEEDSVPQVKNILIETVHPTKSLDVKPDVDNSENFGIHEQGYYKKRRILIQRWYTEDSIRLYLQEVGRIRLLSADEEIELIKKITDLSSLEKIRFQLANKLTREPTNVEWAQEVEMLLPAFLHRLHLGRRAKHKMVQANLRFAVSIAKKYMNRGLSFQDLIQEGGLGLIRAVEKFDYEKGYKFSTYATWWIRQAITGAIADQSRTIRLPVNLYETISRIKKTTKLLSQEMGRKPTEEEIATRMEMTIEKLRFIAKSAQLPISLDIPVEKGQRSPILSSTLIAEEDTCLGDLIEADCEPEEQVSKNLLREDLEAVLATLSPREKDVLRLRYGLDDGRMKTLEEIGQIFNTTRERIRQIEAKALRKLRHPNRNNVLRDLLR